MTANLAHSACPQRPTRFRFVVVALAILLGMVTYLDRTCISTLAPVMQTDLELSDYELGWVFTVFAIAYGTMGVPCARWGDHVGTRKMLAAIVIAWSAFTIATGAAVGLVSLLVIRFLFGIGEAGAWPAVARTLSRWIPYRERGTAQGIVWIGAHITVGFTPMLVVLLNQEWQLSWRWIFILFGAIGLVWSVVWYILVRDEPCNHPAVNQAELRHIMAGRKASADEERPHGWTFWRRLLTHRNIVALCLMYMPNSVIFYFCITWLPKYLSAGRNMEGQTLAFYAGLPLILSVAADLLGGPTTDLAVRCFGPRYGRAGVGFASYILAGLGMLLAAASDSATAAATFFALGTAANMFLLGSAWGTCQDISGAHAGVVSATMNTAGQAAAAVYPLLVIYVKNLWGWEAPLVLLGVSFLVGAFCWCFINPEEKVFD